MGKPWWVKEGLAEPCPNWRPDKAKVEAAKAALRGKDLACWCGLDEPCHADIWLEVVNS